MMVFVRVPIYDFILVFSGNICPTLSRLSYLQFDLSRSLNLNLMVLLDSPYTIPHECLSNHDDYEERNFMHAHF